MYSVLQGVNVATLVVDMTRAMLPIAFVNGAFTSLTGYSSTEAIGRNCRFLQSKATEPAALSQLITAIRQRTACRLRITNARKDGSAFVNELTLHPVHDSEGGYRYSIGVLVDGSQGSSSLAETLRGALPTVFEAELAPSRRGDEYAAVEPLGQWKQYQPMTSKLIRLLWSTDTDGAMRKLLTLPSILSARVVASIGQFLSAKEAKEDEMLLGTMIMQLQQGDWAPMAGRTDQPSGAASALDRMAPVGGGAPSMMSGG